MINKEDVFKAHIFMRENNSTIPSVTLDFMKDAALKELEKIENGRTCFSCKHDGLQSFYKSACTGCCSDGGYKNFLLK